MATPDFVRRLQICSAIQFALFTQSSVANSLKIRGLIVGVSTYPTLPQSLKLRGPPNDVAAMTETMQRLGINANEIKVIADQGSLSKVAPTKQAITAAFQHLVRDSKSGDWVVVYFSGHGSQQPHFYKSVDVKNAAGDVKIDGLSEIFLPIDVGRWDPNTLTVSNAILDTEIREWLSKLTANGVFVWAIFDTCHAAGISKSQAAPDTSPKYAAPEILGIPSDLMQQAAGIYKLKKRQTASVTQVIASSSKSQLVSFFAASEDEPAPEELLNSVLSQGKGGRLFHGLFTHHLVQALRSSPKDFMDLSRLIGEKYQNRPYPTPVFEGNLGIRPPFFGKPA